MSRDTSALRRHALVLGWIGALVLVVTRPLARDPAHLLPPHHDPYLFTWAMLSSARNLFQQPGALMEAKAFYPGGGALTFSEPLIAPGLLAQPIWQVAHNPVLAYNVTLLVFWVLSGWLMYVAAFRLLHHPGAALVSAVIFTASAYRTAYYVEFPMELVYGLPLAVFFLVGYTETRRTRLLAGIMGALWLQALSVWYYAVITACGLIVLGAHVVLLRWRCLGWRAATSCAVASMCLATALAPLAAPYFRTRGELGFERGLEDATGHSADLLSYLDSGPNRWYHVASPAGVETALFPGFLALGLTLVGVMAHRNRRAREAWRQDPGKRRISSLIAPFAFGGAALTAWLQPVGTAITVGGLLTVATLFWLSAVEGRRWQHPSVCMLSDRQWIRALLTLAVVGFLFSLGPVVHIAGNKAGAGLFGWVYPWALPLHAIRVATRMAVLVVFAVALLAGFGARALAGRVTWRPTAVAILVAALVTAEYLTSPLPYVRVDWSQRAAAYRLIERLPEDASALELPMTAAKPDTAYMFYALGHGKQLVNGFSGFVPPWTARIRRALERCGRRGECGEAEWLLRRLEPVCYVVVHEATNPRLREAFARSRWATLVANLDGTRVYRLAQNGTATRIERVFSANYAHAHPAIRLPIPPGSGAWGDRHLRVRLNGHLVARSALSIGRDAVEVRLPEDQLRAVRENHLVLTAARPPVLPFGAGREP